MSNRQKLKTILDTIAGRTLSTAQAADIAAAIASAYRHGETLSADQEAAVTLAAIRRYIRGAVHAQQVRLAQQAAAAAIVAPDLGEDEA